MDFPCNGMQPWFWLLVSMSQHTNVLQMPTWQHAPIKPKFSPHSDDLFSQGSHLLYPSKTHALGGILLYQNPVTIMWVETHVDIPTWPLTYLLSLDPSTWRGNPCCLLILHKNAQHHAFPISHEWFLARTAFLLFSISGATTCYPFSISGSYLNRSVIRGETWYPG